MGSHMEDLVSGIELLRVVARRGGAAALLCLAGLVAAAPAARAEGEDPPLVERSVLTGNWGGLRDQLVRNGVEIGLTVYGDLLGVNGGLQSGTRYAGLTEATVNVDLDRLLGLPSAQVFVRAFGTYGLDPGALTGSLNAPSNLATAVPTFTLFEAWVEKRFFGDTLGVRLGLYAADTEFDVKETAGVFMNGGFGTGVDLSESGLNGPCIFPVSCLGVRVKYAAPSGWYLQAAALDGVAGDPDRPWGTHVAVGGGDGWLFLGEAGLVRDADSGRFLHAAVGGWYYTRGFDDLLYLNANGDPMRRTGSWGVYALVEGELYREPGQGAQGLSGFLRAGAGDPQVNAISYSVSGGLAYTGLLPGRDEDIAAFGVSAGLAGNSFIAAQRQAGVLIPTSEIALEWAYRIKIVPWMSLLLDAQYIINPGVDPAVPNAFVAGLRYQIKL